MLTKAPHPVEVAHIYPFCMRETKASDDDYSFWSVLRMFWSEDRVNAWYSAIFTSAGGTEEVFNLMCFAPTVHRYHERAYFALEPKEISDDKKCLTVKFFWLPQHKKLLVPLLHTPSIPEDLEDGRCRRTGLWNVESGERILSGSEICLETTDPVKLPLPDLRLLEMQWFLHRMMALSGNAEPHDYPDDSDDDWEVGVGNEEHLKDEWSPFTASPAKHYERADPDTLPKSEEVGREGMRLTEYTI